MHKDFLGGLLSLIAAVIYTIIAFQIPDSNFATDVIQPNVFPILIGIAWVIVSFLLAIKGFLLYQMTRKENVAEHKARNQAPSTEGTGENEKQDPVKVTVILAIFLAYLLLFFPLGYVLSTILFIAGLTIYLERRKWKRNLIYAIVFPLIIYFVFNDLLSVYLPTGPFF
ncbi:tripartite tricarboxylate transporter TctB family protein [Caldibacillus lycopersici]|uniref:Tripartite tricarboxylate transporter TctB family protein n=1 Tax=Perspicuibacillus lycopersici TaxID=1325689 RepID=A0AAE3ITT2_9BACI|nr:tripartite tricarboxylate transporter TctB family protein [Perspicuibacillus lycopersici]MCU9612644.1 tripartite tricarboxylate transporter TctB family protein [Perspicuibacillus lycopersici]